MKTGASPPIFFCIKKSKIQIIPYIRKGGIIMKRSIILILFILVFIASAGVRVFLFKH